MLCEPHLPSMVTEPLDDPLRYSKPYMGPASYQPQDAELFYGRDAEASDLIATVLSKRLTVLHAQSGAGKTSLLNARLIPGLESRGWTPVRVVMQDDPVESTRLTTMQYVLPPPQSEQQAVARAAEALSPDQDVALGDLVRRFDALAIRDPSRRTLLAPVSLQWSPPEIELPRFRDVTPFFCRLLRSRLAVEAYAGHLSAISQWSAELPAAPYAISGATRVSELLDLLASPSLTSSYVSLLQHVNVPTPGLLEFFGSLYRLYRPSQRPLQLVIIWDQFEELFTRFVDVGSEPTQDRRAAPDWRLREEFFDQLERLYAAPEDDGSGAPAAADNSRGAPLALRYVLSMREEYIARLDRVRTMLPNLSEAFYHLRLLEGPQAEEAVKKPARQYGYAYADACYAELIGQLLKERRFVEPAHLQIVCEKLWSEQGRQFAEQAVQPEYQGGIPQIPLRTFADLGGAPGILRSFFRGFLDSLAPDDRLETLEMLEPLITGNRTRNIIELEALLGPLFRDSVRRKRLLDGLVYHAIVRVEPRLGDRFVEITHEFLIPSILEAIREELVSASEYSRYRVSLQVLERFRYTDFRTVPDRILTHGEFVTLYNNRERIRWTDWAAELLLRSAILLGVERQILQTCFALYHVTRRRLEPADLVRERFDGERLLDLGELRLVNAQRESLKLTQPLLGHVLRSTLQMAEARDRTDVAYWTRRYVTRD